MNFYHCKTGAIQGILLTTRETADELLLNFSRVECLTSDETFDFGADPELGIFKEEHDLLAT